MFCQNCGNEIRQNLNYCNRCGARLTSELEKNDCLPNVGRKRESLAYNLSMGIGWVSFAGIVSLAILIGTLIRRESIQDGAVVLVFFFAALVFGIIFLMLYYISHLSTAAESSREKSREFGAARESLSEANTGRLAAARESAFSVTEHTTHTLEEVLIPNRKN